MSLMTYEKNKIRELSKMIKGEFSDIKICLGGIHPSVDTESCLEFSDYVFFGESEKSLLELIQNLKDEPKLEKIPNMAYKKGKKIIINKQKQVNKDLDLLPFPGQVPKNSYVLHKTGITRLNYKLFKKYSRYGGIVYNIISSRGCPLSCSYCWNSLLEREMDEIRFRSRSVDSVISELREVISSNPDIRQITFHDDSFYAHSESWVEEFSAKYKKYIRLGFLCQMIPSLVTEKNVKLLKKAGLTAVIMGLDSGSDRINKEIYNRHISNDKFLMAAKILNKYKIACIYDVLVDNPYETEKDIIDTIMLMLKVPKPYLITIFSLKPFSGTTLKDKMVKDQLYDENTLDSNYLEYKDTYLNKLIRITPFLPKGIIKYLIKMRQGKSSKFVINVLYWPTVVFIEPLVGFWILLLMHKFNLPKTLNTIAAQLHNYLLKRRYQTIYDL